MWSPLVKACRRSVHKQRLPFRLDKLSRRPETLRRLRYGSPVQGVRAEERSRASSVRTLVPALAPGPVLRHPSTAAPGVRRPARRGPRMFRAMSRNFFCGSIDDPSSIPQSSFPAVGRGADGRPSSMLTRATTTTTCGDGSASEVFATGSPARAPTLPSGLGGTAGWAGRRLHEACVLDRLGQALASADPDRAATQLAAAVAIFEAMGAPESEQARARWQAISGYTPPSSASRT